MAEERQLVCDGCRKIVHGKFKAAFISRDYVIFKGQMGLNVAQTRDRLKDFFYLTPKYDGPPPELVFCFKPGMPCIEAFINAKRVFIDSIRIDGLRKETDKTYGRPGQMEREFVVGGKKDH